MITRLLLCAACALTIATANAAQYSKLRLITAAKAIDKWGEIKSFIASSGMVDEWQSCVYISDDYPLFAAVTNSIVEMGLARADEIDYILAQSKDPAISDSLLKRAYDADMSTSSGRIRWHGSVVSTHHDTNRLESVYTYTDGYVHRIPFAKAAPGSIAAQLSAAERKAKAEARRLQILKEKEERKNARIAELQTNLTYHVEALMQERRWPEDLARLYLVHELNTLIGTNVVEATIRPAQ
jgi:hypothetical protein